MSLSLISLIVIGIFIVIFIFLPFFNTLNMSIVLTVNLSLFILVFLLDKFIFNYKIEEFLVGVNEKFFFAYIASGLNVSPENMRFGMLGLAYLTIFLILSLLILIILKFVRVGFNPSYFETKNILTTIKVISVGLRTYNILVSAFFVTIFITLIGQISYVRYGFMEPLFNFYLNFRTVGI